MNAFIGVMAGIGLGLMPLYPFHGLAIVGLCVVYVCRRSV
jgi:hypothetical protein